MPTLTVRRSALADNLKKLRRLAGPAIVMPVVKANAYGLGMIPVTQTLADLGCQDFFVARIEEATQLRATQPDVRIFVLEGLTRSDIGTLLHHRLVPVLNTLETIKLWHDQTHNAPAAVQIDSGINRSGLTTRDALRLAQDWRDVGVNVVMWISHLANGDEPESIKNPQQLSRLRMALHGLPAAPVSLAASAGILLGADYCFDAVRPGIALYGANPLSAGPSPFRPVACLTAPVLEVRELDAGETIGYGATHMVTSPVTIATVALGYADGFLRTHSGRNECAIEGIRVPIVGRISMDLITLDVSAVPTQMLHPGARVEVFGDTIALETVATNAGTIPYEILTSVGTRVRRVYSDCRAP